MKRHILTLTLGASMIGMAALAACGGGGGSAPGGLVSTPANSGGGNTQSTASGAHVVLTINRSVSKKAAAKRRAASRAVAGTRKPAYISTSAKGVQIAVSAAGSAKTVYADISTSSPLCTVPNNDVTTCTIAIPTLGTSETIVATEVDQTPIGDTNGYGTGFGTGSNILAVGTTTAAITGGANSIALAIGPVVAGWYDCTFSFLAYNFSITLPSGYPTPSANSGVDVSTATPPARFVLTGGVATTGIVYAEFFDADGSWDDLSASPAPLADVNGSPVPNTIAANNAGITFAPAVNNASPPPPSAYTATGSIPTDAYQWNDCVFVVPFSVAASATGTSATITINNNLTALNPFLVPPSSYAASYTWPVAFLTASAVSGSPAATGPVTATVTGTDYLAVNGMGAESAYQTTDGNCNTSGSVTLATVAGGSINTTTWQQIFTITPSASGTCTFLLYDQATGVVTKPVSVTIGS